MSTDKELGLAIGVIVLMAVVFVLFRLLGAV
jgi:hypothetical protein